MPVASRKSRVVFARVDKDRWKCACATWLHYHEPAVFECRDLPLLRPVSSRHQLGRGFPRIELDALDAVRWVTGVFPIISSDFKSMIPIFCNRRFNFLAGAELNRICAANECGGKNKTAKYAPRISQSIHVSTVSLAEACATDHLILERVLKWTGLSDHPPVRHRGSLWLVAVD